MKDKPLLLGGLGAGVIALVVFIVGFAFVWSADDDESCRSMNRDGEYGMMNDGGMMDDYGCGLTNMREGMMGDYGMMSGGIGGMMGMVYGGMMGSPVDAATAPITIDAAADAARRYIADQGNTDLKLTRILEFTNGFYAHVSETSTGTGAYELKIDRNSGAVSRTLGPGMTWNRKYKGGMTDMMGDVGDISGMEGWSGMEGMEGMSGMMDIRGSVDNKATTADMTIKPADAASRAQKYADVQFPGSSSSNPDMFYGYYTVSISRDGRVLALLSVNGYSGQVWAQTWPGSYLGAKAF